MERQDVRAASPGAEERERAGAVGDREPACGGEDREPACGGEARPARFTEVFADARPPLPCGREVAVEAPVAIEVNGIGYAVMMATPSRLEDYATGFALGEGLIAGARDVAEVIVHEAPNGWIVRLILRAEPGAHVLDRVRRRVTESGCGLCGLESLEALARPLPRVAEPLALERAAIFRALGELGRHQALGRRTGAVHAALLCGPDGAVRLAREDVGRHNALDKLVGAALREGVGMGDGFALLTSRCSFELVEKAVVAGLGALVTLSAPTTLALDRAAAAGLPLVVLAREDSALATG